MTAGEPTVLRGARVTLVSPTAADIDRIAEVCNDPQIAAWTTVPSPYERSHADGFVGILVTNGWASGRSRTWGIRIAATDELCGMIGLDDIREGGAEIGFWLAPAARGLGYMSEAVELALDYAFAPAPEGAGLQRVEWHAFAGNAASAAVARRAGFRFEGVARLGATQRGERRDDWQAGLLRDDPRVPAGDWPDATYVQAPV